MNDATCGQCGGSGLLYPDGTPSQGIAASAAFARRMAVAVAKVRPN